MFKDWTYHLTMVKVDARRFDTNPRILPQLVYPESLRFISIIVFEKSYFEKYQAVKFKLNIQSCEKSCTSKQTFPRYLQNKKNQRIFEL